MKINNNKLKTKQFLKLHLLKHRVYNQKINKSLSHLKNADIAHIMRKLKNAIQLIFAFHRYNKTILFIGVPGHLENKINYETNHVAIPKFYKTFGLLINKDVLKSLKLKYKLFDNSNRLTFLKLNSKPGLIVIFDSENIDSIIKESYKAKIPVVHFNSEFNYKLLNNQCVYDVPGNFNYNKRYINNLFFQIINSLLNK